MAQINTDIEMQEFNDLFANFYAQMGSEEGSNLLAEIGSQLSEEHLESLSQIASDYENIVQLAQQGGLIDDIAY